MSNTITRNQIEHLVTSGADIAVSHKCGNYYEYLRMHSATICDDTICVMTTYPSASKLYNIQGDNYFIYHTHSLENTLILARTGFIAGDGKFGGMFGLPNCTVRKNWPHMDQRWVLFDAWQRCDTNPIKAIRIAQPVKVRIETNAMTAICETDFIIQFDDGDYSIRTTPAAVQVEGGVDIMNFEIHNDNLKKRTWHIRETPCRLSPEWFAEKVRDLMRLPKWDVDYERVIQFEFDLLCQKSEVQQYIYSGDV